MNTRSPPTDKMAEEAQQPLEESSSTQPDEEVVHSPQRVMESPTHEVLTEEDLENTARDFASYLVINNQQEVCDTSTNLTQIT